MVSQSVHWYEGKIVLLKYLQLEFWTTMLHASTDGILNTIFIDITTRRSLQWMPMVKSCIDRCIQLAH